jgi:hypothetical protein
LSDCFHKKYLGCAEAALGTASREIDARSCTVNEPESFPGFSALSPQPAIEGIGVIRLGEPESQVHLEMESDDEKLPIAEVFSRLVKYLMP